MKKVLFILVIFLMAGFASHLQAQNSVNEAQRFAELCLKKVKKHRFKKLKEYYPEAMQDINRIIANTTDEPFSHDRIADLGAGWITLMETLDRFSDQELTYKGSTINFNIRDYSTIYQKAKAIACRDHYLAGVATMDNYKNNYFLQEHAIPDFQKSLRYGNIYKNDIYLRAATIYYDQGLQIYNSSGSFSDRVKAAVPFGKALKWVDPFKNTRELMASLYFDEASGLLNRVPVPSQAADQVFKNKNIWPEMGKNLKDASAYFRKADTWVPDYKSCRAREAEVNQEAASILYMAGMKYASVHTFRTQSIAAGFFHDVSHWEPGYKDAGDQARMARERSHYILVIAHANGTPVRPSEIQKKLSSYRYMINPDVSRRIGLNLNLNNPENWPAVANRLGRGFILLKRGHSPHRGGNVEYRILKPEVTTRNVVKYTKVEKGVETEISESDYKAAKRLLSSVKNKHVGFSVHKYQGMVTTLVYRAELVGGSIPLEIWDVRDPYKPILLKILHPRKRVFDKIIQETYHGNPKAKPNLINDQRNLMTKAQLMERLHLYNTSVPSIILKRPDYIAHKIMSVVSYRD